MPHRLGLTATLAGIAALGGAGSPAAVLPAPGPSAARHAVVAETASLGLPAAGASGTSTARARGTAAVPGAGPFPPATAPIAAGVFDL